MRRVGITQTNEFKGAVSGAGMANLVSDLARSEGRRTTNGSGRAVRKARKILNHSPFLYLKKAKTPTLILPGPRMTRSIEWGQSQELYRGLKAIRSRSGFGLYPREPHGFQEMKHRLDMQKRWAWLEKYVKNSGQAPATSGKLRICESLASEFRSDSIR